MKQTKKQEIRYIPTRLLVADPNQPRQEFDPIEMKRLEKSIEEKGVLVPLAVEASNKDTFLIVDGERRFRASTRVGLAEVPAIIYTQMDKVERLIARFHLQEQQAQWGAFDKARAISILKEEMKMSNVEIAEVLGMNPGTIKQYLSLLALSSRSVKTAEQKRIPFLFLFNINLVTKKIEDKKVRVQLENALVDKITAGLFTKSTDIRKYGRSIKKGGDKIINKIINEKDYTPQDALSDSKAGIYDLKNNVMTNMGYLGSKLKQGLSQNLHKAFDDEDGHDVKKLLRFQKTLNEFIKYVGGVDVTKK